MNLLMISGDRSILQGKKGAFWYTLQEFRKHWNRIDIICPHPGLASSQYNTQPDLFDDNNGAPIYFHPNPGGLLSQPMWIKKVGTTLHKEIGIDVMTVHEYPPFYNGIGAKMLSKKLKIPYVLEIHHIVGFPKPSSFFERIGLFLSWAYLAHDAERASKVRVVNGHVQVLLAKWGIPQKKLQLTPSFYINKELIESAETPPTAWDVSFAARLVPNKGLDRLLQAIAMVPNCRALIIGDGPDRTALENKSVALGLKGRVQFVGWLPGQEDVMSAIKSTRMFVMNSRSEGGPRSLLEAMGCGVPVIATPVGIAPDIIEDGKNGIMTDGTPKDLAEKITFLMKNESWRKELGQEAKRVLDRYDRSALIQEYALMLKSLT